MGQYLQNPVGHKDRLFFLSQQTLFTCDQTTRHAFRMCSFNSEIKDLKISQNGCLSFFAKEDSNGDIYLYNPADNSLKRITFFDDSTIVNLHLTDTEAIFASCYKSPFYVYNIYSVDLKTLEYKIEYKTYSNIAVEKDTTILQQFGYGYHSWKGYQGGQAARLYYSKAGSEFKKLQLPKNNCYSPLFVDEKLYFLTDANGNANIHQYNLQKDQIVQKTFIKDFYIRDISKWGDKILFSSGGDIYSYHTKSETCEKLEIIFLDYSSLSRNFVFQEVGDFSTYCAVNNSGKRLSFAARGNVFLSQTWSNSYLQLTDKIRYRISTFLDNDKLLMILDAGEKSIFEIYDCKKIEKEKSIEVQIPIIKSIEIISAESVLVLNDKGILFTVDLSSGQVKQIVKGKLNIIAGFNLSEDKKWLAYSALPKEGTDLCSLWLYEMASDVHHEINTGGYSTHSPSFSKDGKYLYFLSERNISSKWNEMYFDLGLEVNSSICAICLNSEVKNPFRLYLSLTKEDEEKEDEKNKVDKDKNDKENESEDKKEESSDKSDAKKEVVTAVKLDELNLSISEAPKGKYLHLEAISDSKLLLIDKGEKEPGEKKISLVLKVYDLPSNEISTIMTDINQIEFSENREWMMIRSKDRFRVGRTTENFNDSDKSYKNGGCLDTSSTVVKIDPRQEWENILEEQSFLVSYNFWKEIKVDLSKYKTLLPKVNSKEDLNKIIEELNGEMGCSHAYILNRANTEETYHQKDAYLAAEFQWNGNGYKIESMYDIPEFPFGRVSPLLEQGLCIKKNDVIVSIDGIKCSKNLPIEAHLSHKHLKNIIVSFLNEKSELNQCIVKSSYLEKEVEYTKWVVHNRNHTHKISNEQLGYVHIPDMGPWGFKEFMKSYIRERTRDGLIIDVRYNRGGNVHPMLINMLANIETGLEIIRDQKMGYPHNSNKGKLLLLCNEKCGSDGDLMVYSFKKRKLGKVVGMRTWGGIIGILPDHDLIDNTKTSQPEFATWMHDIGLAIENEGVHPDVEVQISVEDTIREYDRQLEVGVKILLEELA